MGSYEKLWVLLSSYMKLWFVALAVLWSFGAVNMAYVIVLQVFCTLNVELGWSSMWSWTILVVKLSSPRECKSHNCLFPSQGMNVRKTGSGSITRVGKHKGRSICIYLSQMPCPPCPQTETFLLCGGQEEIICFLCPGTPSQHVPFSACLLSLPNAHPLYSFITLVVSPWYPLPQSCPHTLVTKSSSFILITYLISLKYHAVPFQPLHKPLTLLLHPYQTYHKHHLRNLYSPSWHTRCIFYTAHSHHKYS